MSSLNRLAKETVIYGLSHILPRILHFGVMTIYLTHRFNNDTIDYGIYSDLYAYAAIILAFMVFRMDTAYFRFGSKEKNTDEVFTTTFIPILTVTITVCSLLIGFAPYVADVLNYPDQPYYVRWFAFILGLDALSSLVYAKFRLANRPIRFLFFRVANVVMTVAFVLLFLEILPRLSPSTLDLIYTKLGLKRELDFVFLSNLMASLAVFIMILPELIRVKWQVNKPLLMKVLVYSWPLVIVAIAGSLNQSLALILQKYWLGGSIEENQAMVGIFSAGAKLAILLNLFTTAFNYAAEPFFFNNAAKEKSTSVYGEVALAYTIFACVVVMGTYLFIDVVMVLIGSSYRGGIVVVPILLMAYVFLGLYYMVAIWYKLSDHTKIGAWVSIFGVMLTLVFSYFLIPSLGIVGSAWTSLICYIGMVALCYQWGKKIYPIDYPWVKILTVIIITGFVVFLSFLNRMLNEDHPMFMYSINTLLFLFTSLFILFKERVFLRNALKRT